MTTTTPRGPMPAGNVSTPRAPLLDASALADPSRFVSVPGVPIQDAHDRFLAVDGDDGPEIKRYPIRADLLKLIASNSNDRVAQGEIPILVIGHTHDSDEKPEADQPPVVGYMHNFTVGERNGLPTIFADLCYKRSDYDRAKAHPYRSAETVFDNTGQMPASNYIHAVGLLTQPPKRKLGIVDHDALAKPSLEKYSLASGPDTAEMGDDDMPGDTSDAADDPPEASSLEANSALPPAVTEAPPGPDSPTPPGPEAEENEMTIEEMKSMFADMLATNNASLMGMFEKMFDSMAPAEPTADPEADGVIDTPDEAKLADADPTNDPVAEEKNAMSQPSGDNAFVPEAVKKELERNRLDLKGAKATIERQSREFAELKQIVGGIVTKNSEVERNQLKKSREDHLTGLIAAGANIDLADAVEKTAAFDDKAFAFFADTLERNSLRSPIGRGAIPPASLPGRAVGAVDGISEAEKPAFYEFCSKSGITDLTLGAARFKQARGL